MGETALDRLRRQKETINAEYQQEYSIEEQMDSSNENQLDADSLVLTQMSSEALSTLREKRKTKAEKVELEVEKKEPEQSIVEEPTIVEKKKEGKKKSMSKDKLESFVYSLSIDLLQACKKQEINFKGFNEEQLNIIFDFIIEKVKENE